MNACLREYNESECWNSHPALPSEDVGKESQALQDTDKIQWHICLLLTAKAALLRVKIMSSWQSQTASFEMMQFLVIF